MQCEPTPLGSKNPFNQTLRPCPTRRRTSIEPLEPRRLLSGVYIEDRVLFVDGTAGNDTMAAESTGGSVLRITLNGVEHVFIEEELDDFDYIHMRGFAGHDAFRAHSPFDTLIEGGDGNDEVMAHVDSRLPTVVGGAGDDVVHFTTIGTSALSPFDGGAGRDTIIVDSVGGPHDLDLRDYPTVEDGRISEGVLTGNDLHNHLTVTGFGPNTLMGGNGNDTLDGGGGADLLRGGAGLDTVDYSSHTTNLGITIDGVANDGERGASGPPTEGDNVWTDVETVLAGSGNDWVFGNGLNNLFRGNGGNDFLGGFGGNDALYGGAGNDRLEGGNGNDYLQGDAGNDALLGEAGTDFFRAGGGDDWLYSRDSVTETVDGGPGFDRAQRDPSDSVLNIESFIA